MTTTPPVDPTPQTPGVPAGWYPHSVTGVMAWWDGTQWLENTSPAATGNPSGPAAAKKPGTRLPLWALITATIAALIFGVVIGGAGRGGGGSELTDANNRIAELEDQLAAQPKSEPTVTPSATPDPEPAGPATTFAGSGTYIVNTDIAPGLYRSETGGNCYWARLSGLGGSFGEIIANDNVSGQATVQIDPSDVGFETNGCGTWTIVG